MLAKLFVFSVFFAIAACTKDAATSCTPPTACPQMSGGDKEGTGGFAIEVKQGDKVVTEYEAGAKYMVTLKRTGDNKVIKGFTLQANEAEGADATGGLGKKYLGEFGGTLPDKTQVGCGSDAATRGDVKGAVSHKAPGDAGWADGSAGITFEWTAPASGDKDVFFNAVGVHDKDNWFGNKAAISTKLTKKAATQAVDCATFTEQAKCTDDTCEWKDDKCAKKAAATVDCATFTEQAKCTDDTCEWKDDKCAKKATTTPTVDCTTFTEQAKCTDDTCEWKDDKCAKKATDKEVVDCTADALKTKEACEGKPDDCMWDADKTECKAKPAAKCSDKTTEADCGAMTGCTWDTNKCATTASVECPKKTTEDACKGMTGCKWNTDKCEAAVVATQDDGAFKLGVGIATILLAVFAHLF